MNSAIVAFAAFIGRSPDMATAEDLRLFQLHQTQSGMQPPSGQTNLIYPLGAINVERWRTPFRSSDKRLSPCGAPHTAPKNAVNR